MTTLLTLLTAALLALQSTRPTQGSNDGPPEVIQNVMKTAGIDAWNEGKRLQFTFNVGVNGENKVARSHDWNLVTGEDAVTSDGKTISVNVWAYDASKAGDAEKAAFEAWTNDSYWLLMPLKLGDPGVKFGPVMTTRDLPASRANVTMSFGGVGLTPGDQYDLSIDLKRGEISQWTYRPDAQKSVTWTWEGYQDFDGLRLATNHVNSVEGGPRIYFTDVRFTRQ